MKKTLHHFRKFNIYPIFNHIAFVNIIPHDLSLTHLLYPFIFLGGVQIKQEIDSDDADDDLAMNTINHQDHDYITSNIPMQQQKQSGLIRVKEEFTADDDTDGSDYNGSDSGELDQENPIMKRNRQRMNKIVMDQQQRMINGQGAKNKTTTNVAANNNISSGDGTQVFIKTLLHALECK